MDGRAAHHEPLTQVRFAQLAARLQLDGHDILAQDAVGIGAVIFVRLARIDQERQAAGLIIFHKFFPYDYACLPYGQQGNKLYCIYYNA